MPPTVLRITPGPVDGYDTYISESAPATNYKTATLLSIIGPNPVRCHALLQFFLPPALIGATVLKAELGVYVQTQVGDTDFICYRVTQVWYIDDVVWNNRPVSGTPKSKMTAVAGNWTIFNVLAHVQGWVATPASNLGFCLQGALFLPSQCYIPSSDYLVDPLLRPYLEITYQAGGAGVGDMQQSVYDPALYESQVEVQANKNIANGYAGLDENGNLIQGLIDPAMPGLIDQSQLLSDSQVGLRATNMLKLSQSFESDYNLPYIIIDFSLRKYGTPVGNIWVELYIATADAPTGAILMRSYNLNVATLMALAPGIGRFILYSSNFTPQKNTRYCLVLNADYAISAVNFVAVRYQASDVYANGIAKYWDGANWLNVP